MARGHARADDLGIKSRQSLALPEERVATTTVEVLAEAFKEAGTPFIVGHPGGESVELMEAGRQRGMRLDRKSTRLNSSH